METFVQSIVSGLLTGSLYAMIGVGLTVIFGVMRIINMAHGEMVMLGMYGAFLSISFLKVDPFLSIVIWIPIAFLIGVFIYRFLLKNIVPAGELNTLLYTAGLSLFIANLVLLIGTGDYRTIKLKYAIMPLRPFGICCSHSTRHRLWNGHIDHGCPLLVSGLVRIPAEPSGQRARNPKPRH